MKEWMLDIIKGFNNFNISIIKEYTLKFAKQITKAILDNNNIELQQLVEDSCEIRDGIEFYEEVDRNKEFYYGYLYAYENIATRIIENKELEENTSFLIGSNSKLKSLVKYLWWEKAARQKDVAEHLNMKANEFANFMQTDYMKKVDIIAKDRIGRNVIYSLNAKGRKYMEEQSNESEKNYSKSDILEIISYLEQNHDKRLELLAEQSPVLDEEIVKKIYSLLIREEFSINVGLKGHSYLKIGSIKQEVKGKKSIVLQYEPPSYDKAFDRERNYAPVA